MAIIIILLLMLCKIGHVQSSAGNYSVALPGCPDSCGGIVIPYPFGIGPNCSRSDAFKVTCNKATPYLGANEIINISIPLGEARFNVPILSRMCYNASTKQEVYFDLRPQFPWSVYELNIQKNELIVTGCNVFGRLTIDNLTAHSVGCMSTCDSRDDVTKYGAACSGIGCCQTTIPKPTKLLYVDFDDRYNHSLIYSFSRCSYGMIVENNAFRFSPDYAVSEVPMDRKMPVVFDWVVGNKTCKDAMADPSTYACKSGFSVCLNSGNGGYLCNCSQGYEGNPYLHGGCQDIDECTAAQNPCPGQARCRNLPGTYQCSPPKCGFGRRSNSDNMCEINLIVVAGMTGLLGFIISIIILSLYIAITKRVKLFEKRKQEKLKHKFFVQNRGLLLQQLLTSHDDTTQKMRIFRLDELQKATNHFDNALVLGRGGHGEVYKGILSDQRVVAIKRSKMVNQSEIDQFINEVVILSQVNHRNVVKLFGCCLETEVPLLVYEFISNGTLYHHLHSGENCSLTWKQRLRIALEAAGAISYLHSSASMPIFHRDIKSANILLDDYFTAKVSDFGISRSVQIDQTAVTTAIQGTYGYLDPEYYHTGRLTHKSDVYSFGVILTELLTRQKPLFSSSSFEGGSLILYFGNAMEKQCLFEILDPQVVEEGNRAELEAVAKLAQMCLRIKGEERPAMKEVVVRLEILWQSNEQHKHPWTSRSLEEKNFVLFEYKTGIDATQQDTFEQELQSSTNFPR